MQRVVTSFGPKGIPFVSRRLEMDVQPNNACNILHFLDNNEFYMQEKFTNYDIVLEAEALVLTTTPKDSMGGILRERFMMVPN